MISTDDYIENAGGSFEVHRQTRVKGHSFTAYIFGQTERASEDLTLAEAKELRDWLSLRIREMEEAVSPLNPIAAASVGYSSRGKKQKGWAG